MIKIILHEKQNNWKSEFISLLLSIVFFVTIALIVNLVLNINTISNSDWFEEIQRNVSDQNVFVRQQVDMIKTFVITYGVGAIVIITFLFAINIKSFTEKSKEKLWLMHAVGYNKSQILMYCIKSYFIDLIIVLIPIIIIVNFGMEYVRENIGINEILKDTDISFSINYLGIIIPFIIVFIYVTLMYRKSVNRIQPNYRQK